ncbi:MAG: bacterial Ig-like domain-containing protein [Bacteroidales bacterium]|nr:bacterial Ig-like domain-containing protein [Bacteroidales bacterium]
MEPVGPAVDFEPKVLVAKVDDNVKADDEPSRTSLAEGRMVRWSSSDRIVAFEDENPTLSDENTTVTDNGAIASFTFSQTPLETNFFWALYPADMTATYDWAEIHTAGIPVEQRAVAGSFANNANLAVADATVDDDVQFKNIGALLSLSFTSTKKISSIILKTTEETLAGAVLIEPETLDFVVDEGSGEVTLTKVNATSGTYYFVVYPGTYEGIDVIFRSTDGGRAAYHSSATLTIGRNEVMFIRDFQIKDSKWEMIPQVPGAWTKVTDVSDLADGDEIVITDEDAAYAISTTQNTNNRSAVAVTASADGNTIEINDDVQIITLEASGDNWKFNVGDDAYLYASSGSSNQLKTAPASTAGNNGVWAVTASSAVAQGSNGRNDMRFNPNNGNPMFACYASTSTMSAIAFYKRIPGRDAQEYTIAIVDHTLGTVTTDPADKAYETQTVTITPVPADESYAMASVTVVDDEDNEITVTDNTFVMPSGNVTITPVFSAGLKTVTTVAENGSISVEPGPAVAPGTEVTITADPDTGYEFVSWSVTGATPASTTENPTTFTMPDDDVTVTATFAKLPTWVKTDLADIAAGDTLVIVDLTTSKAMTNANGTSNPPSASLVTLASEKTELGTAPAAELRWVLEKPSAGNYRFRRPGTSDYLYCTDTNNGVKVGSNPNNTFSYVVSDTPANSTEYYLQNTATSRFIGVYNSADWRSYGSVNNNIKATVTAFFIEEDNTVWNLKGIAVTTRPTKTTYEAGENFDATGMVVTATYEDEAGVKADKQVVLDNADLTITPSTSLTAGTTSVTISYEGESTTQAITVVEWVLDNIEITTPPTKTVYEAGESFDATGMVVKANYIDNGGSSETKSETLDNADISFSPSTIAANTTSVTVSYGGKSTAQAVSVVDWVLDSIEITTSPTKTTYVVGDSFDPTGMVVTAHYIDNNGSSAINDKEVDNSDLTFTPDGALALSDDSITVSYTYKTVTKNDTQAITVSDTALGNAVTFNQLASATGCTYTVSAGGSTISSGDLVAEGAEVTLAVTATGTGYSLDSWKVTKADDATTSVTVTNGKFTMPGYGVKIVASFAVTDNLTRSLIGVTGTGYTNWSDKTSNSSAVYAGRTAGGNTAIQFNTYSASNKRGIVSFTSGGYVKSVALSWNSNTTSGRSITVRASTSAITLDNLSSATSAVSIPKDDSATKDISSGKYTYVGFQAIGGALYLDNIAITWIVASE